MPEVQLTASVADILTLPVLRQFVVNRIDDVVTLGDSPFPMRAWVCRSLNCRVPSSR